MIISRSYITPLFCVLLTMFMYAADKEEPSVSNVAKEAGNFEKAVATMLKSHYNSQAEAEAGLATVAELLNKQKASGSGEQVYTKSQDGTESHRVSSSKVFSLGSLNEWGREIRSNSPKGYRRSGYSGHAGRACGCSVPL